MEQIADEKQIRQKKKKKLSSTTKILPEINLDILFSDPRDRSKHG